MSYDDRPKPIRVVTLIDRLVQGGAERLAVEITARLDPARFDRTLCVTRWSDEGHANFGDAPARWRAEVEAAGVRFVGLDRSGPRDLAAWRPLMRILRRTDVVHSHMFGSCVWGVVLGRAARVPVVVSHEHSWTFEGQRARQLVDRHLIARGSDTLIACSRTDQRRMTEVEGIPPGAVTFMPNGIEARLPSGHGVVRDELGIPRDALVVGAVGSMRRQKRYDVLLQAAARLARTHPGVRVLVAGDGPDRGEIDALSARLGLDGAVTLLGARTDVPDVLAALDIAVNCSDWEGSPLAVMEYMEAGCAVVGTTVGGVPDLIDHGVHGLLVAPGDDAALAAAIGELLDDPERRAAMGAAARTRRRVEFDLSVMVASIEALYDRLLAKECRATR